MSGRPRTTSFAEGNKQPLNPPLGGMKISSKCISRSTTTTSPFRSCTFAYCLIALYLYYFVDEWRRNLVVVVVVTATQISCPIHRLFRYRCNSLDSLAVFVYCVQTWLRPELSCVDDDVQPPDCLACVIHLSKSSHGQGDDSGYNTNNKIAIHRSQANKILFGNNKITKPKGYTRNEY